ncbi:MAG TPA: DUF1684 domain-containing protein [Phototrophicaceae bacterium]|nr:DUF1684 domain-containing protein [Phototrophicaceae bacterium]
MTENHLLDTRRQKDDFFKQHPQSPLTPEQQAYFSGLRYYDLNPALDLTITVERLNDGKTVPIQTTTGEIRQYQRYGHFTFTVDSEEVALTIYQADFGFFLPFVDAGAGTETYPAGRYLEPEDLGDNLFRVDFNLAYNPYCAYSPEWSCPITPAENRLKVAIRAGEKLPEGDWVGQSSE